MRQTLSGSALINAMSKEYVRNAGWNAQEHIDCRRPGCRARGLAQCRRARRGVSQQRTVSKGTVRSRARTETKETGEREKPRYSKTTEQCYGERVTVRKVRKTLSSLLWMNGPSDSAGEAVGSERRRAAAAEARTRRSCCARPVFDQSRARTQNDGYHRGSAGEGRCAALFTIWRRKKSSSMILARRFRTSLTQPLPATVDAFVTPSTSVNDAQRGALMKELLRSGTYIEVASRATGKHIDELIKRSAVSSGAAYSASSSRPRIHGHPSSSKRCDPVAQFGEGLTLRRGDAVEVYIGGRQAHHEGFAVGPRRRLAGEAGRCSMTHLSPTRTRCSRRCANRSRTRSRAALCECSSRK